MRELRDTHKKTGTLHHAYLIEGEWKHISSQLLAFFEDEIGVSVRRNPDCYIREYETFGIDDGHAVWQLASNKSFSGSKRLFVLSFSFITKEAQNSLLKLLEEPTPQTHFFLVVPSANILLPTVLSRLFQISTSVYPQKSVDGKELAEKFLKMNKQKRLIFTKRIIDSKDRQKAIELVGSLELFIRGSGDIKDENIMRTLRELEKCRSYLHDRSPSVKMILEHLSLIVPS